MGASAWVAGGSGGSSSLLVSAIAGRGSTDVCGWVVALRAWSPVTRDELPTGSPFPSLFFGLVQRCSQWAPPLGLLVVPVARQVFWFLPLLDEALRMYVAGWLLRGLGLWSLGMSFQLEALFRASSWVASRGHSLELTNSGRQCWGSIAGGYQTLMGKKKSSNKNKENGTESKANSYHSPPPPGNGVHV
jgi:hypothetical protein